MLKSDVGDIDFLEVKIVLKYFLLMLILLLSGFILHDFVLLLYILPFVYYVQYRKFNYAIVLIFIWIITFDFYKARDLLYFEVSSKYLGKVSFYIFILFLVAINRIKYQFYKYNFYRYWFVFLFSILLNAITNGQSVFVVISVSSCFFMFFLLRIPSLTNEDRKLFLNVVVAGGLIQTVFSIIQNFGFLPSPLNIIEDGYGGFIELEVGLDDVACGTFSLGESHITSWYCLMTGLLLFLFYFRSTRRVYLIFMLFVLMQLGFVDSKIITAVGLLMFVTVFILLILNKNKFKISSDEIVGSLSFLIIFAILFIVTWGYYYLRFNDSVESLTEERSISGFVGEDANNSIAHIASHFFDWGKISAFGFIFDDFVKEGPFDLLFGYGYENYSLSGKNGYIQSLVYSPMQENSFTNGYSGLIRQFAVSGFLGIVFFFLTFSSWYSNLRVKYSSRRFYIASLFTKYFLIFTLIISFLYSVSNSSNTIVIYFAIVSILESFKLTNNTA